MATTSWDDLPPVTTHAVRRWAERTPEDSTVLELAWMHAQRVDAGAPFQGGEVRYHRASQTLLVEHGNVIATVYAVGELESEEYHAVKHALPPEVRR
ncbi:hypothetical protein NDI56_03780 [Haloarcula sp. S1CR25-12]|uniref:RelE toxin-related domain-containing protein n=1 Tax=Haloarcula saliterrae TaxID=2950534 RepID=A0ABU2F9Y4_9EURY|nr:hypothetical protein [Haloarcula sp. S1CR25-12]MDS0258530.1 hypothetical protein [Haloarcula sp. S1CR25-12]